MKTLRQYCLDDIELKGHYRNFSLFYKKFRDAGGVIGQMCGTGYIVDDREFAILKNYYLIREKKKTGKKLKKEIIK